ncbi:Uncharacterised protein [Chlamydia abortus]|nr:Uncharacterised protein [Chlamydia abortus]
MCSDVIPFYLFRLPFSDYLSIAIPNGFPDAFGHYPLASERMSTSDSIDSEWFPRGFGHYPLVSEKDERSGFHRFRMVFPMPLDIIPLPQNRMNVPDFIDSEWFPRCLRTIIPLPQNRLKVPDSIDSEWFPRCLWTIIPLPQNRMNVPDSIDSEWFPRGLWTLSPSLRKG